MRAGVAWPRVPAAVAERIELLHIADRERGLRLRPRRAGRSRRCGARADRTDRTAVRAAFRRAAIARDQNERLVRLHRHDRGGQPDLDRGERGVRHRSLEIEPERIALERRRCRAPIASIAAIMRPRRPSMWSASVTSMMFGIAVGEASRIACAIAASLRCGLSAQAAMNAPAVERLMPARQCMTSGVARSQWLRNSTSAVTCSSLGGV